MKIFRFKRRKLSLPIRATLAALIGCFLVLYVAGIFLCALVDDEALPFQSPFATRKFNRKEWFECSNVRGQGRGHMLRDVTEHYLHKGMTKAEATGVLGEGEVWKRAAIFDPKWTEYSGLRPFAQADNALEYYLGKDLGDMHGVNRAMLYVFFDRQNRCVGWKTWLPGSTPSVME